MLIGMITFSKLATLIIFGKAFTVSTTYRCDSVFRPFAVFMALLLAAK